MHEQHPAFQAPADVGIPIWRYMNLAKFVSILKDDALPFVAADRMNDEFEGSISKPTLNLRREFIRGSKEVSKDLVEFMADMTKLHRQFTYLSCWTINERESAAMWNLYLSGEAQGIAIRSTYERLSDSITDQREVYIGTVKYIDYDTEIIPDTDAFYYFVHKRISFEHERELRALATSPPWLFDEDNPAEPKDAPRVPAIPIGVDLEKLIEKVYVSPKAPQWFADLIPSLLERYGRNWPVHHSSLDADPIY